jgi:prophage maintenance system killer protein
MNKRQNWEIMIYKAKGWSAQIDVKLKDETIWLNLNQIADLFGRDKSVISRHIRNIYKTQELNRDQTVAFFATVQKEWKKSVERQIEYYNLDAIISVWYRVNSKNATNFRIWATSVLKNHLVQWYSINTKRLSETGLDEFEKAVALIKKNIENNVLDNKEIKWMLNLVTNYAHSWIILQKYDEGTLSLENMKIIKTNKLEYKDALKAIDEMKKQLLPKWEVSEMFGIEKNDGLKWVLDQVYQTFDWQELYPSIQEKAASLIYFIIKNHPFADGNKKIWAFLLLVFLAQNNYLYRTNWNKRIDDDTLIALTLLVATSESGERDMILKLVASFLSD